MLRWLSDYRDELALRRLRHDDLNLWDRIQLGVLNALYELTTPRRRSSIPRATLDAMRIAERYYDECDAECDGCEQPIEADDPKFCEVCWNVDRKRIVEVLRQTAEDYTLCSPEAAALLREAERIERGEYWGEA